MVRHKPGVLDGLVVPIGPREPATLPVTRVATLGVRAASPPGITGLGPGSHLDRAPGGLAAPPPPPQRIGMRTMRKPISVPPTDDRVQGSSASLLVDGSETGLRRIPAATSETSSLVLPAGVPDGDGGSLTRLIAARR